MQTTKYQKKFDTDITYLKGVGPTRGKVLKQSGILTIKDLLYHFPRRYIDRTNIKTIKELKIGDTCVVLGKVENFSVKRMKKRSLFEVTVGDGTGYIKCVWFHGISWISEKFQTGDSIAIFGKIEFYQGYRMIHPEFDILNDEEDAINTGSIISVYSSNSKLKAVSLDSRGLRRLMGSALEVLKSDINDFFVEDYRKKYNIISLLDAINQIHKPKNQESLKKAIYRLKFNEHFFIQLLLAIKRHNIDKIKCRPFKNKDEYVKKIYDSLPFTLTKSQIKVLRDIRTDLESDSPMNRLIQGDVGCGKTIVAVLAASMVIDNNAQVCIMAPTEILSEQHFISFKKYCDLVGIKSALLTGSKKEKEKKEIYKKLKNGKIELIVGTHALIQDGVEFNELGLIVIDEQHRFGVEHRKTLINKGINPNVLAMTATPIPRTLAMAMHGDMDISTIDEQPENRIPITTKIVPKEKVNDAYKFMENEMQNGRQCFVVYPLIEESEKLDLKAAESGYKMLNEKIFPNYNIGYINGKMPKEERDHQMEKMINGEINCLVSTTVIEVGIDIPNASVILIENSERFGLTQLHQLRGRVGRGEFKSYCLLAQRNSSDESYHRLNIMEKVVNGFKISDEDLKLRGPGEFYGKKQHGYIKTKLANFNTDKDIVFETKEFANSIVKKDSELNMEPNEPIRVEFMTNFGHMLDFINIG